LLPYVMFMNIALVGRESMKSKSVKIMVSKINKSKGGLTIITAIAVIALFGVFCCKYRQGHNSFVFKVNNEPVSKEEFNQVITRNRAKIYTYFNTKYGSTDSKNFWQSSYNGENPAETIKKEAVKQCVRIKIEQILAKEKGIIEDTSYSGFLNKLKSENTKRKEVVKNNGILYGPIQYSEDNYFSYVHSNMVIRLKEKLEEDELSINNQELKNFYDSIKRERYSKQDYIKIYKIYLPFDVENVGKISDKQEKKKRIEEAKLRLDKEEPFEVVAKACNKDGAVLKQIFDDSTARADSRINAELKAQAVNLDIGQISEIFEAKNAFYIIKCEDRKHMGFKSFEEVKDIVKKDYVNRQYEKLIDELVSKANIEINQKVYEKVMIN